MLMLPKDPCHNPHCINNITYASRIANLAPYKSEIRNDLSIHKALVNYYSRRFPNVTNRIGLATLPDDEDSVDSYKDTLYNQVLKKRSKQQHVQPPVVEQFILHINNNDHLDLTRRRLPSLNSSRSFKNQLNFSAVPPLSNVQERATDWKIKLNRSNSTLTHSDLIGFKERRHILPGYHDDNNNNNNNGNSLYEDEPWNNEDCNSFAKQTQIRGVELKKNIRIPEFNNDTDRQQHTKQQIFINQNQSHHLFSDSANHNCHNKYFSHHKPGNNIDVQNNPSRFEQFVKHGREIKITDDNNNNLNFIPAAADDKLNNRHIDDRTPVVDNYNYAKCCGHICDGGSTNTKPCYSLKNGNGIISGTLLKSYSNLPPISNKAAKTPNHLTRSYSVRNPDSNFGPKFLKPRQQNIVSNFLSHNNNYNCASSSSTNTTTTHNSTNQKSVKFVLPELTSRAMKFGLHSRKKSLPGEGEEGGMDFNCSPSNASFERISLPETAPGFGRDETSPPHHVAEKINTIKSSPKFYAMEQGSIPTQFFSSKIGYHNIKINDTLSTTTSSPTLNIKFHDNSYYGLASQSPICADSSSTQKLKKRAGLVSGRHDDDEFDLNPTVQRRYSMIMKQRETALAAGLRNRTMGEDMTTAVLTGDLLNVRFDAQTYTSNSALVSDLPNTNCSSSGVVERDIPPPIPLFNHRNNNNNNHRRRGGDLPTPVVANTAGHPTPQNTADHHHHPYEYETADTALIHDVVPSPPPGGWGLSRRVRQDKVTSIMSSSSTSGHSSMEDADIPKFSGIQDEGGNVNTLANVQDNKANVPSNNNAMNDLTNRYSSTCSERSKTDSMYSASNPEKWSFEGSINSEREDSCNISEHYSLNKDREDFPVFLHTDTIHDYDDKAIRKSSRCGSNKGSSTSTASSCKKAPLPPPRNVSLLKQNNSPVTSGSNGAESSADSDKITPKPKVVSSNLVVEKRNQISIIPTKLNLPTVDTIFSDGTEDFLLPRISNQTSNFMFNREKIRPIIMDEQTNNDFVKDTTITTPTFDRKGTNSDISPEPSYRHGTTKIRPKFVDDFSNPNIVGGSGVGVPPIPTMASFPLTKTLKSLFINHHPNPGSSSSSSSDSSNCSISHPSNNNEENNIGLHQQNHQKIMSTSFHESCSAPTSTLNHNRPSLRSLIRMMNNEKKVNCQSFYGPEEGRHHNHHHHPSVSPDTLKSIRDISRYDSKLYHQHDNHTTSPSSSPSSGSSQPDEEECDENYVLRNLKAMPLLKRTDYYILKTK